MHCMITYCSSRTAAQCRQRRSQSDGRALRKALDNPSPPHSLYRPTVCRRLRQESRVCTRARAGGRAPGAALLAFSRRVRFVRRGGRAQACACVGACVRDKRLWRACHARASGRCDPARPCAPRSGSRARGARAPRSFRQLLRVGGRAQAA